MQLFKSIAFVAVVVAGVNAQQLTINTPASIVQCQPVQLTYSGGTPPYFISILPGGQPSAPALEDLGQQSGTSLTWNADIASGTQLTFQIRDSSGATGLSGMAPVQASGDSSCIGKNSQSSSATGSASSTGSSASSASGSTTSPASTSAGSTTSAAATSTSSTPTTASSPASAPSSTKPATTSASSGSPTASSPAPTNAASSLVPGSAVGILGALLAVVIA